MKDWKHAPNRAMGLGPRVGKLPDEFLESSLPDATLTKFTGKSGATAFVDTNNCYHFGSRPGRRPRRMLLLYFQTAFGTRLPCFKNRPTLELFGTKVDRTALMNKLLMFGIENYR